MNRSKHPLTRLFVPAAAVAALCLTGPAAAQDADDLAEVTSWLQQGVNSALLTQAQADVMLEALRGQSAATEALIRQQVNEALNLSAMAKAAIAEEFLTNGTAAVDRVAAGLSAAAEDTQGRYVRSLDVVRGEIFVTYGNDAHSALAGKVIALTPYVTDSGYLVWQCGLSSHGASQGYAPIGGTSGNGVTTVPERYLPSSCSRE